ncbi:Uncharacterised protein [Mycobacteroides abscessus subsp. abscessus]|nr:Uncharacterised protein [Mycobacteroides abscessus subsp. abscessus]
MARRHIDCAAWESVASTPTSSLASMMCWAPASIILSMATSSTPPILAAAANCTRNSFIESMNFTAYPT